VASAQGLRRGEPDDALAAATILRQYLDEQKDT
jgi:RNase H-fold protein (predicted Holliday junction resolvase)